jgi:hypothetical protein
MEGARRGGGARRFRVRAECEDVSEVKRRRDEAGHVLTNGGHHNNIWNLMYELGAADKDVKHPKRFTNSQIQAIKGSPYAQ